MGVSLERVILVNSIFQKYLWETPGIAPVYAVFSPVRPAGTRDFQQPLVLLASAHRYSLCFRSLFALLLHSAHSFTSVHFGVREQLRWRAIRGERGDATVEILQAYLSDAFEDDNTGLKSGMTGNLGGVADIAKAEGF